MARGRVIRYGTWSRYVPKDVLGQKRRDFEYQDFVVAEKASLKKATTVRWIVFFSRLSLLFGLNSNSLFL